jgi:ribonuclease HII
MQLIAGVDEAGRGCLAGPVVAAAVVFFKNQTIEGLRDSKRLSANKREQLFQIIKDESQEYSIGLANHLEVDQYNILKATMLAMQRAIDKLHQNDIQVLIDGPHCPVMRLNMSLRLEPKIGGDNLYSTVAAASVLAKVTRDQFMEKMHIKYPQYQFDKNKGYPTKVHISAIKEFGPTPIHRMTFKPEIYSN